MQGLKMECQTTCLAIAQRRQTLIGQTSVDSLVQFEKLSFRIYNNQPFFLHLGYALHNQKLAGAKNPSQTQIPNTF